MVAGHQKAGGREGGKFWVLGIPGILLLSLFPRHILMTSYSVDNLALSEGEAHANPNILLCLLSYHGNKQSMLDSLGQMVFIVSKMSLFSTGMVGLGHIFLGRKTMSLHYVILL